jgi:hypothetical protein
MKSMDLGIEVIFTALTVALLFTVSSARADEALAVGKVRGAYAQAANGVFIEKSVARAQEGATRWVDVETGAGTRKLVQLPDEMHAGKGDVVEYRTAPAWAPAQVEFRRPSLESRVALRVSRSSFAGF